jgi:carbonic anhydrase
LTRLSTFQYRPPAFPLPSSPPYTVTMGQGHDETTPYVPYDFVSANNRYTTSPIFTPDPIVGARSRTGIITCCDARCSPEEFFMLPPNEAFVIRNGGGRTAEESVVRTLALIQVLSEVKEIKVVHHTGKYTHTHTQRERERERERQRERERESCRFLVGS